MIAIPFAFGRSSVPTPARPASASPTRRLAAPPSRGSLDGPLGFDEVFGIVRAATRSVLGVERSGLGLALSDLPSSLGAYWPVTGNMIVMNEGLVGTMRQFARSEQEYNSFVFVILAHEYLHTLGYLAEAEVRPVTARVTRAVFGPDHPATRMAEGNIWSIYPFLQSAPEGRGRHLRIVPRFDLDATANYIR